jgi:membrane protein YqaA with SNARE-associated domain
MQEAIFTFVQNWGYVGLFVVCFLAATILPLPTEAVFLFLLATLDEHNLSIWWIYFVAIVGNLLGAITSYSLARFLSHKIDIQKPKYQKYKKWVEKHGYILGLLAWVPFLGSPLILVLGFMRTHALGTFICMFIGIVFRFSLLLAYFL